MIDVRVYTLIVELVQSHLHRMLGKLVSANVSGRSA